MPDLAIGIRTHRRTPNYLHATLAALEAQGAVAHVWTSEADPSLTGELVHHPSARLTPNETGIALVGTLESVDAPWLLMLEDDVAFCADFVGSVTRWLRDHASDRYHVYRLCAFRRPIATGPTWAEYALREQGGSQAVVLRAEDARAFAQWATAHRTDWRPKTAPFQSEPHRGFDKLVGYWALATWPHQRVGLVSRPQFVRHVGRRSSFGRQTLVNDAEFAGAQWRYAA